MTHLTSPELFKKKTPKEVRTINVPFEVWRWLKVNAAWKNMRISELITEIVFERRDKEE